MNRAPVTGNLDNIIAAAMRIPNLRITSRNTSYDTLVELRGGDEGDVIRKIYADMEPQRQALRKFGAYKDADNLLCKAQSRALAAGEHELSLMDNIYGWAVGDTLEANIRGGRWAQTSRGATLEDCFVFAAARAQKTGTTIRFDMAKMPQDVRKALALVAGSTATTVGA